MIFYHVEHITTIQQNHKKYVKKLGLQLGYLNRNTRIPNAMHHTILGDRTNTHQGVSNQALMLQQFGRSLFLKSSLTAKQVIGNPATTERGRELMNLFS